jgi:hypothetical protein
MVFNTKVLIKSLQTRAVAHPLGLPQSQIERDLLCMGGNIFLLLFKPVLVILSEQLRYKFRFFTFHVHCSLDMHPAQRGLHGSSRERTGSLCFCRPVR